VPVNFVVDTKPKFNQDIELKKIDLVSEEIRNRYFTALGVYFALLLAMIAAAFEIGIQQASTGTVPVFTVIGLLVVFPLTVVLAVRTIKRYKGIFLKFQPLIKNVEDGKANGDLKDILKALRDS
jgi:hypothetical protein